MDKLKGMELRARTSTGEEIEEFAVKFIGALAFGVRGEGSTDKEFLELFVGDTALEQPCKVDDENEKYNLPCPYNPKVKCVQYPEEECDCDPCKECEIKLKASEELARKFHETYERLAPDFGYKTRKASAKPWKDVPKDNKQLMIAVCKEILPPYSICKPEQHCKPDEIKSHLSAANNRFESGELTPREKETLQNLLIWKSMKIEKFRTTLADKEAECERLKELLGELYDYAVIDIRGQRVLADDEELGKRVEQALKGE